MASRPSRSTDPATPDTTGMSETALDTKGASGDDSAAVAIRKFHTLPGAYIDGFGCLYIPI